MTNELCDTGDCSLIAWLKSRMKQTPSKASVFLLASLSLLSFSLPLPRWPRSTWTTCCVQQCQIHFMGLGTGFGLRVTRHCWPWSMGRPWPSSPTTPAPPAGTCWTPPDCAARRLTEHPHTETNTNVAFFNPNACSYVGIFNASVPLLPYLFLL